MPQRVSADFHIKPLAKNEVTDYISFRLGAVGAHYNMFTAEACTMIAEASHGIPRVINILCDTALVYGYSTETNVITAKLLHEVIEDKQNFGIFATNDELAK